MICCRVEAFERHYCGRALASGLDEDVFRTGICLKIEGRDLFEGESGSVVNSEVPQTIAFSSNA